MNLPKKVRAALWVCLLAGTAFSAAEEGTGPALPPEEPPAPGPTGERPRVRYWLRDPASPEEPKSESTTAGPRGPALAPAPAPRAPTPEETAELERMAKALEERRQAMQAHFDRACAQAQAAYERGDYAQALSLCEDILKAEPRHVKAARLRRDARLRQLEVDEEIVKAAADRKDKEAQLESEEHSIRPPVRIPELRPHIPLRHEDPDLARRKKMAEKLEQRITVDFIQADLEWILNTLFVLTGVNIIADSEKLKSAKPMTLHINDQPLREVIEFIVRNNDGIQYTVKEDSIWITASDISDVQKIMIPRVYPLTYPLIPTAELGGASKGQRGGRGGGGGAGNQQDQQQQEEKTFLENALKWIEAQGDPLLFPTGSKWFLDRATNNLVVYTTPTAHDRFSQFLDNFDQPPIQVLVKARFLDIQVEDNDTIGINVEKIETQLGLPTKHPTYLFNANTPVQLMSTLGDPGSLFQVTGSQTDPKFSVVLKALLSNRRTRILSEPQILAINNKQAYIDISTQFSYVDQFLVQNYTYYDQTGNPVIKSYLVPQFAQENIGFSLFVTPSVGRDMKTISLHLQPVLDSLAQGQSVTDFQQFEFSQDNSGVPQAPTKRPTIDQTTLETVLCVEDNGFVIIGGLIRNRYEIVQRKVPFLYKIPFLGRLFQSSSEQKLTSNLMIIIEAQIITPRGRTLRTAPAPDDGDIREGGTNRAPGQVSRARRPAAEPAYAESPALPGVPGSGLAAKQEQGNRPGWVTDVLGKSPRKEPAAEEPRFTVIGEDRSAPGWIEPRPTPVGGWTAERE